MAKITPEIEELFRKVRTLLGAPIRRVELTDEALLCRKSTKFSC